MVKVTAALIEEVSRMAVASPRMRQAYNFHDRFDDPIQRMLNAMEPGTYIRPHKHESPDKTETFILLKGKVIALEFDDDGRVRDHAVLEAGGCRGVEFPPRTWHMFIPVAKGTVLYELKSGPYDPERDKHFAPWAPAEGSSEADGFWRKVLRSVSVVAG